jgi:hypothetical protein
MAWDNEAVRARRPEEQLGWDIIGAMVRRRRIRLGWSQRDLWRAAGVPQSTVSRLENGKLSGIRFKRFALVVGAMGGLDPDLPHPPRPGRFYWD